MPHFDLLLQIALRSARSEREGATRRPTQEPQRGTNHFLMVRIVYRIWSFVSCTSLTTLVQDPCPANGEFQSTKVSAVTFSRYFTQLMRLVFQQFEVDFKDV